MPLLPNSRILLGCLALCLTASAQAAHIKVFLLGGQSNMVGTGADTAGLPTALQSPQADVLFYYGSSHTTLRPGSGQDFGPEVTFGRTIADAFASDNFGLIKYAVSGADLTTAWDPNTGTVYSNFRTKVTDGLDALTTAGHTYEIVGMLWTQGERDARIGRTTEQYEADLIEFIADLRSRYGADLPFFFNRLSTGQTNLPDISKVRAAQENVAAADSLAYLIDADGMSFHDELHFDAAGQIALGEAFGQSYINSRVPDTTNPEVNTLSPVNGAPAVVVSSDLMINFTETVTFGTGLITIREALGDAIVEAYDVGTAPANLTLSGSTVTINPTANLDYSTSYYVEVDATAIDDFAGNSFAGFSGGSTWAFTSEAPDTTDPTLSTLSPANEASDVSISANLEITFSEAVALDIGFIRIRETSGDGVVESFDVASPPANLSLSGSTITIDPASNLDYATSYYVEIDATAIDDLAGNSFAGFTGSSTWSFTTAADLTAGLIAAAGITATASSYNTGGAGFSPVHSIDGSGLDAETGVHNTSPGTSWLTPNSGDITSEWIQWDLGGLYTLGAIHVWNANQNTDFGTKEVDIYISSVAAPGDPEGDGAANWTKLGGTTVTLPEANNTSGYTGFDLETALGVSLPDNAIRFIRFELNGSYGSDPDGGYTGIAEIQFFEAAASETFADWINTFSGLAGQNALGDDPDGDGILNGIENYFGTHPGEFSQGLASGTVTGNSMTFTHPLNDTPASNLTASYRWSKDLLSFHADGDEFAGSTVSFMQDPPSNGMITVTATISGTSLDRLFVHIEVAEN